MKKIDRLILVIFSTIILIEAIILGMIIAGWIKFQIISEIFMNILEGKGSIIIFVITIVCALLSVKSIFFGSKEKSNTADGQGVLMQNDNGKLMISKATLVNLTEGVVKNFSSVEIIGTKIEIDNENHVMVDISITVSREVIIKELTVNIQNKVKEAIKRTSDLEVKEVNVRIKNIVTEEKESNNK